MCYSYAAISGGRGKTAAVLPPEARRDMRKKAITYLMIVGVALLGALNYQLFVFPNRFAPAGLNGICTMIQYLSGISVGYMSLLINIPLAIIVYRHVSKALAVRSMVYVLVFSGALLVLGRLDLSQFAYETENGTSTILGPLVAGVINGFCYSMLLRASAFSGGTDFVAAIIHKRRPEQSIMGQIFLLNVAVAVASYFVYDFQMEPVLLCIMYSFTSSTVSERLIKSGRSALRYEIITEHPEQLSQDIIQKLHHSATLIPARGVYSGKPTNILVCIVNKTQSAVVANMIRHSPNTFATVSQVGEVMGNFKHLDPEGRPEKDFLDSGDDKAV